MSASVPVTIITDRIRGGSPGQPLFVETKARYASDPGLLDNEQDIVNVKTLNEAIGEALGGGAFLRLDGSTEMEGPLKMGGYPITNISSVNDYSDLPAVLISDRQLADSTGSTIVSFNSRSSGFGIVTGSGGYGFIKTDAITGSKTHQLQNKNGIIAHLSDIELYFVGVYPDVEALEVAVPIGLPGEYAIVDAGVGEDAKQYIWDDSDSLWILGSGTGGVTSFNSRIGVVMPQLGDYDVTMITNAFAADGSIPLTGTMNVNGNAIQNVSVLFNQLSDDTSVIDLSAPGSMYFNTREEVSDRIIRIKNNAPSLEFEIVMQTGSTTERFLNLNEDGFRYATTTSLYGAFFKTDLLTNGDYIIQQPDKAAGSTQVMAMMEDIPDITGFATETYVNNRIDGLTFKVRVDVASIANVNIASAPATIDGISYTRVLLKNQTTPSQNGVYDFNGTGSVLTRSSDANTAGELVGATILVVGGSTNFDTWWTITNDTIVLDTTSITFTQTGGAGTYNANLGLLLTGNTFSIATNGIANSMIRQSAGVSVIGRSVNSSGNVADITASSNGLILSRVLDVLGFNNIPTILGYTPESAANKATGFGTLNNTLYPSVQAVDNRVKLNEVLTIKKSVTAAQVLTSFTTPIPIGIPAPGIGFANLILSCAYRQTGGTTPYATNTSFQLRAVGGNYQLFILSTAFSYQAGYLTPVQNPSGGLQLVENADFALSTATGNPTLGNYAYEFIITYKVISL